MFNFFIVDVTDSTFKGTILHEPQPYVPSNPIHENDIERLLSIESESMDGSPWSRVKKTKDAEVWRRDSIEEGYPPITKVIYLYIAYFDDLLIPVYLIRPFLKWNLDSIN